MHLAKREWQTDQEEQLVEVLLTYEPQTLGQMVSVTSRELVQ